MNKISAANLISESNLIIDALQCWNQDRLSQENLLEVLTILTKSPRGRTKMQQMEELLSQALQQSSY